jgi:pyruvate-ferredoxin/flavodoxin oxidoreductase
MRVAIDARTAEARELLASVREIVGGPLADGLLGAPQASEADIHDQRQRVELLRERLEGFLLGTGGRDTRDRAVSRLLASADYFVKKSVWLVGGEDWAYDTGYGGLDHVLASVANLNVLVFDTDTRRKSGGHGSTVTPRSTIARDAASAKAAAKKGLGLLGLVHRHVYVAHVALGADDTQTVRALLEAESYDGPSLVIAYAHCTAHGIEMDEGLEQQRRAVACGHWPLFRYDPRRASAGEHALVLDSRPPLDIPVGGAEARFRYVLEPDAAALPSSAQDDLAARWQIYSVLAGEL